MRPQRNNITLDVDSALALMQEIYNGLVKMDRRVEALETLLIERGRSGERSHGA